MSARLICAFAGCGKSTWAAEMKRKQRKVIDLDVAPWSKGFDFPLNYIHQILDKLKEHPDALILISTHDVVIDALRMRKMEHLLVYPAPGVTFDQWVLRYTSRNDTPEFIEGMKTRWDKFMQDLQNTPSDNITHKYTLERNEYLRDIFPSMDSVIEW